MHAAAITPETRSDALRVLRSGSVDVLILGGGINGAGIARDLAMRCERRGRSLRIALVEQGHFASGTSGRNSQLIHGGLRYLKRLEVGLVREALRERATLLEIAPHLVEPLPFLIPLYGWLPRLLYGSGLWLYDFLAGGRNVGRHRALSRRDVSQMEPGLATEGLTAGAAFFDCRVHSARFVLENIADAARRRVAVANYARAERTGTGTLRVTDLLSGEIFETRARVIVDARGPWAGDGGLRLVRGSHIVLPRLNQSDHAIAYFEPSGRVIFVIPWGEDRNLSLVGTTDVDHTSGPDDVRISREECAYLMGIVRRLFPHAPPGDPISTYSSLRPLARDDAASPTDATRSHRIWRDAGGVVHVTGGKYTTYRAMSEEAVDLVAHEIAPDLAGEHATVRAPLGGNSRERLDEVRQRLAHSDRHLLVRLYGVEAERVLSYLPPDAPSTLPALRAARIAYACRHEMAQHLTDLLTASTYWGYEQRWTRDTLRPYASAMADHLGWDEARVSVEIESALNRFQNTVGCG